MSDVVWQVVRQEATVYGNGEIDHEFFDIESFSDHDTAWAFARKLNADPNRDVDYYYFVQKSLE